MAEYKVKDLKEGMKDFDIEVEIDFLGQDNSNKGYGDQNYRITFVKDETGEIRMTFFGDDAMKVKEGDKVVVKKAYVTSYRGQLQLNYSQDSKLEIKKSTKKKKSW